MAKGGRGPQGGKPSGSPPLAPVPSPSELPQLAPAEPPPAGSVRFQGGQGGREARSERVERLIQAVQSLGEHVDAATSVAGQLTEEQITNLLDQGERESRRQCCLETIRTILTSLLAAAVLVFMGVMVHAFMDKDKPDQAMQVITLGLGLLGGFGVGWAARGKK